MNAPDLTRKLLGFRTFEARSGGLEAIGVGRYHWWPGINKARCLNGQKQTHEAPSGDCRCGLYAYHDIPQDWTTAALTGRTVGAAILAWGRVELHYNGFRAEYAEVGMLTYDKLAGPKAIARIKSRAKDFDVPAVDVFDLEAALVMLDGERVPDHILPERSKRKEPKGLSLYTGALAVNNYFSSFLNTPYSLSFETQKAVEPASDVVELPAIRDRLADLGVRFPGGYRKDEGGLWTPEGREP